MRNFNQKKEVSTGRRVFYFLAFFLLLSLFAFITYKLSLQIYKQRQIDKEVEALQQEIDKLGQENKDLDEMISYLQTDMFKEREAKDKLGLIKEGEKLVLVKENEPMKEQPKEEKSQAQVKVDKPNYYYWWHYFFGLEEK